MAEVVGALGFGIGGVEVGARGEGLEQGEVARGRIVEAGEQAVDGAEDVTGPEDEIGVAARALEHGCSGFLTKDKPLDEVVDAIRAAASGGAVIAPGMLARLLERYRTPGASNEALSVRELDVLRLLGEGFDNDAIARRLAVTLSTVRNHIQSIIEKLHVHSKLEAVITALREGLITPPSRT